MKNVQIISLVLFFFFAALSPNNAQINLGKLLKDKLSEKQENTTKSGESDVEVEVDMNGDVEAIKNEQPISFDMEVETFKKGKSKGKMFVKITMDTWKTAMETSSDDSEILVIFDNQKGTMTTVTGEDGERQGFEMKQPKIKIGVADDKFDYEVTKTGETKTINGLHCEKYIVEHEDGTNTSWMTQDYGIDYEKLVTPMFNRMKRVPSGLQDGSLYEVAGVPVESRTISKDGKEETVMFIRDVKKDDAIDRTVFDLNGVKVMSMNFGF